MSFTKKDKFCLLIIIILSTIFTIFTFNDDFLYKKEIMKITKIEEIDNYVSTNPYGFKEKYRNLEITGNITNGKKRGNEIKIKYEESYSSIVTEKYKVGDKVFLDSKNIDSLKRDGYVVLLISVFIILLFILGRYRGLSTSLIVLLNTIIFYFGLEIYFKGINLLFLTIIESLIFTIISLVVSNGKNKKTLSAIISVFTSTIILFLLSLIIIKLTDYSGTNFSEMSFLTVPFEDVFLAELLIGGLGAIMDVSITMSSSIAELIEKNKNITTKSLIKSGKAIGKDIMGTMINVLFFTYLCSGLPLFILALRNGYTISNYITNNFTLEETRFLVGSIGIVLTIPISLFISIKIFKRGDK